MKTLINLLAPTLLFIATKIVTTKGEEKTAPRPGIKFDTTYPENPLEINQWFNYIHKQRR